MRMPVRAGAHVCVRTRVAYTGYPFLIFLLRKLHGNLKAAE